MTVCPRLRKNLHIIESDSEHDTDADWTLYDPVCHRFFRLHWQQIEILRELRNKKSTLIKIEDLVATVQSKTHNEISKDSVLQFIDFLKSNNLTEVSSEDDRQALYSHTQEKKGQLKKVLLNSYLFLKLPLVNPDRFLSKLLPWTSWMFHPRTLWLLLLITLSCVYLSIRQWYEFSSVMAGVLTPKGLLLFFSALIIVKILHELGHALAAKKMGCSVSSMGIAFMVFWPILYTDTTDSWRLKRRHQRMWISAAGIIVELVIAVICLFLWLILPDGIIRNICFLLATITWIMTLIVNLNPLMRFDGYFIFSDIWGIENLQERAFIMGRWWLRSKLLGSSEAPPEPKHMGLIVYCYAAWLYRLMIMLTIGFILYHFFFKLLGVALIAFYVLNQLIKPIAGELKYCYKNRGSINMVSFIRTLLIGSLVCTFFLFYPWASSISVPAILHNTVSIPIYAPVDGQISYLVNRRINVKKGDALLTVESRDDLHSARLVDNEIDILNWQLQQASLHTTGGLSSSAIRKTLTRVKQKQAALNTTISQGQYFAPFDGVLTDINPNYEQGSWISKGTLVATLRQPSQVTVTAYISEQDIDRIEHQANVRFYSEHTNSTLIKGHVESIERVPMTELDYPYVSSVYNGELLSKFRDQQLIPMGVYYRVHIQVPKTDIQQIVRGSAVIDTERQSYWYELARNLKSLWIREFGF